MYDTAEEASQKLAESIVCYDGTPVYILTASGKKSNVILRYTPLPTLGGAFIDAPIDDPKWDFKSLGTRLGYTSMLNPGRHFWESVFVSRIPIRHSRQGLDVKTLQISSFDREEGGQYTFGDIIHTDGLNNTIKNLYPSSLEAFTGLTQNPKEYRMVPIHRKLAFFYDKVNPVNLIYRQDKVGYTEDGVTIKLARHKEYLREELTDMIGLKVKE